MTITTHDSPGVFSIHQVHELGAERLYLSASESRQLLEDLARALDFTLIDREEHRSLLELADEIESQPLASYRAGRALAQAVQCALRVEEPASPPASAWVVTPSSPGMPFSQEDHRRSGVNMVPVDLEVAQAAAGQAGDDAVFLGLTSITEAFKVSADKRRGSLSYIIDHGNGAYTVIV